MSTAPLPEQGPVAPVMDSRERLPCPLCDYDLRGQIEPRCPECGYRFDWAELRDPARRRHRYLFEHHPERNVRSFFATLIGGLRPRKFWAELYPTQPSRLRRLLIYWLIVAFASVAPAAVLFTHDAWELDLSNRSTRAWVTAVSPARTKPYASIRAYQAYLDRKYPLLPNPRIVLEVLRYDPAVGILPAMVILWPWATFLALLIFQASMRRAKVRAVHVLRCVIYSADVLIVLAALTLFWFWFDPWVRSTGSTSEWAWRFYSRLAQKSCAILLLVLVTYRLWVAYRKYLRFDHSFVTVIGSQTVVALLLWNLWLAMYELAHS